MNTSLIDGDIILYKAAFQAEYTICTFEDGTQIRGMRNTIRAHKETGMTFTCEQVFEDPDVPLGIAKRIINKILDQTGVNEYAIVLSGNNNHRYNLYPEYKQNREGQRKPLYYDHVKEYLYSQFETYQAEGEADDELGANADTAIICTIDKDLDQVPGMHYNWDKEDLYEIDEVTGNQIFYRSVLKGDSTDNIPGLYKTTGKKVYQPVLYAMDLFTMPEYMYQFCEERYNPYLQELDRNCQLLWIAHPNQRFWEKPV